MYKSIDNGLPCLTPLFMSIFSVTVPFTRSLDSILSYRILNYSMMIGGKLNTLDVTKITEASLLFQTDFSRLSF